MPSATVKEIESSTIESKTAYKPADFASSQDIRWCPGCGDYAILNTVKKVLASGTRPPEKYCFISGIGCSSRFPYYMNTYGIHSIHGRALAVATGFVITRPDMETWVITGDGDGLSIGGNHTVHALRRNMNLKILLINNRIYGLTKGQYSPTSEQNKKTKSSPMGSLDYPIDPLALALAAESTFVARGVDMHPKHLATVLDRVAKHHGSAFVEIYQNCNIFNDGAFEYAQNAKLRADNVIELVHGEPMIFGKDLDKGLRMNEHNEIEVVKIGENGITQDDLLVHDEQARESTAFLLARLKHPEFPEPIGVLRSVNRPTYDDLVNQQVETAIEMHGKGDIQSLLAGHDTWTVEA